MSFARQIVLTRKNDRQERHIPSAPSDTGVDFVTVWTKDIAAAEAFYGGVLGLPCIERYERIAGAEYETGNLTLQLLEPAAIGGEFQPSSPIAVRVDDVAATRAALDPDGNPLILHHRYAPKGPPPEAAVRSTGG